MQTIKWILPIFSLVIAKFLHFYSLTFVCKNPSNTDSHPQSGAHSRTHKADTLWGNNLHQTTEGFVRCFRSFLSFSFSSNLQETTDGWSRGKWKEVVCNRTRLFFSFFSELKLDFVLPYVDLQMNLPYVHKSNEQY